MNIDEIMAGPEVAAAVSWWTERLGSDRHESANPIGDALAAMVMERASPLAPDAGARFSTGLRELLFSFVDASTFEAEGFVLACDYQPETPLAEACTLAGVGWGAGVLPAKTRMTVRRGSVVVACGYASPFVSIFPPAGA